ncbi:unnamed protein product [Clavelina lepadiformis]|uniref:Uncharacterized protein n=1 Tax=Clavelina lepadiformis TaxID=159417 RepID=A0ABP0FG00_CLALP
MRHAAECSFDYQPTMIPFKQWNEFYRRRHQERRHEIRESDRRNAIRTDDVNKVLYSRYVMRCLQDMQLVVAEWLRRETRSLLGSFCPILDDCGKPRWNDNNARGVSLGKRSRSGGEKDHGEILMAYQITKNSQRTSAVRNMLVEELNHGCQTRKGRWIIRVQDHNTFAKYGDATIVMSGWLKEGLDNLVRFNGKQI